jgi:hypothetical protein
MTKNIFHKNILSLYRRSAMEKRTAVVSAALAADDTMMAKKEWRSACTIVKKYAP